MKQAQGRNPVFRGPPQPTERLEQAIYQGKPAYSVSALPL